MAGEVLEDTPGGRNSVTCWSSMAETQGEEITASEACGRLNELSRSWPSVLVLQRVDFSCTFWRDMT